MSAAKHTVTDRIKYQNKYISNSIKTARKVKISGGLLCIQLGGQLFCDFLYLCRYDVDNLIQNIIRDSFYKNMLS